MRSEQGNQARTRDALGKGAAIGSRRKAKTGAKIGAKSATESVRGAAIGAGGSETLVQLGIGAETRTGTGKEGSTGVGRERQAGTGTGAEGVWQVESVTLAGRARGAVTEIRMCEVGTGKDPILSFNCCLGLPQAAPMLASHGPLALVGAALSGLKSDENPSNLRQCRVNLPGVISQGPLISDRPCQSILASTIY